MGRVFLVDLQGRFYTCMHCNSPLALAVDLLSQSFDCSHGMAYLFKNVVNISVDPMEERMMMTGQHTVSDIFCCGCGAKLGWKYLAAPDIEEEYKVGKFVLFLERFRMA